MALDCFDVIVLRDPYEAMEKFKTMDCDMLFNGEKNYYPDYGLASKPEITPLLINGKFLKLIWRTSDGNSSTQRSILL